MALPLLAVAPSAAASDLSPATVRGTVVQVATETPSHEDAGHEDHDATQTLLRTTDGSFRTLDGLGQYATGSDLTVGLRGADVVTVEQNRRATTLSAAPASTRQTVKIAMVVPAGVTQDAKPFTTAQVRSSLQQASDYWAGQTAGQITFAATTVQDWTTSSRTCADFGGLWSDAAKATGFSSAAGEHLVVVLPRNAYSSGACAAYGLGSIGANVTSAGYAYVTDLEPSLWAHELGHNLGLGHANSLSTASTSDVVWNGTDYAGATRVAYGNVWDVMSFSGATIGRGNVGIAGQYRLGLLRQGITEVTTTGKHTIAALPNAADGKVHGLRVVDPASGTAYYVELRGNSAGDDLVASDSRRPAKGVLVTKEDAAETNATLALDATPTGRAASDVNFTLPQGSTLSAASGKLHVTVNSVDGAQATVTVTFGAAPTTGNVTNPTTAPVKAPVGAPAQNGIAFGRDGVSRVVSGAILERYLAQGAQAGALGWPSSDQIAVKDGGLVQRFDGGLVYWTAASGARVVTGAILGEFGRLGWENSPLGFPTSDEIAVRDGGIVQRFQGGLFYWSPATGAHEVRGSIGSRFASLGWENSTWGFPTSGEIALPGGVVQRFVGTFVYWTPGTGVATVGGAIRDEFARRGWENSALGFPVGDEYPVAGGMQQRFQHGVLTWNAATGRVS